MFKCTHIVLLVVSLLTAGFAKEEIVLTGAPIPVVTIAVNRDLISIGYPFMDNITKQGVLNDDFGWKEYAAQMKKAVFTQFAPVLPFTLLDEQKLLTSATYAKLKASPAHAPVKEVVTADGYLTARYPKSETKLAMINNLAMGQSIMFVVVGFSFVQDMKDAMLADGRMKKMRAQTTITVQVFTKINETKVKESFSESDFRQSAEFIEVDSYKEKPLETYHHFKPLFQESMTSLIAEMTSEFAEESKK